MIPDGLITESVISRGDGCTCISTHNLGFNGSLGLRSNPACQRSVFPYRSKNYVDNFRCWSISEYYVSNRFLFDVAM